MKKFTTTEITHDLAALLVAAMCDPIESAKCRIDSEEVRGALLDLKAHLLTTKCLDPYKKESISFRV